MSDSPWLLHYPEGVPPELSIRPETLLTVFTKSVQRFSRRKALYFFGQTFSYQELSDLVDRFACGLAALGICKGDRVALCLPNSPQAVIAYFGILKAGGIVVACNPTYTAHELSFQLLDSGARAIVVLDAMYSKIQHLDLEPVIVTRITDFMTVLARYVYRRRNHKSPIVIPDSNTIRWFHDVLNMDARVDSRRLPGIAPEDVALLQYTGGTTGIPKGAVLRHSNLTANIQQLVKWFSPSEGTENFLAALPLFHVFGMTVTQNICLAVGGRMVLVPDPRDLQVLLGLIRKEGPTVITLVPALVRKLLDICHRQDFAAARFCISGASALPYSLLKKFKEWTGHMLVEGYGLSEASPVTHCNIPGGLSVKRSIGLPIPNTNAKIVDEAGHEVPVGGIGELWVRGPQVMQQYWNKPEETANVLKLDGWLATGDMARMDEDGFFHIVDRKKDMILSSSGFNVYPSEVERVLLLHPHVRDAAVIGISRGDGNESIKAFVVSAGGAVCADELVAHCRRYLAPYKVPKRIEFRSELPRTTYGKILYRDLRKEEENKPHAQDVRAS